MVNFQLAELVNISFQSDSDRASRIVRWGNPEYDFWVHEVTNDDFYRFEAKGSIAEVLSSAESLGFFPERFAQTYRAGLMQLDGMDVSSGHLRLTKDESIDFARIISFNDGNDICYGLFVPAKE